MICPKCQSRTTVTDTRAMGEGPLSNRIKFLMSEGERVFGWWCEEYRMRKRRCAVCGVRFKTIEICTEDLEDAFDEVQRDPKLGSPWREEDYTAA